MGWINSQPGVDALGYVNKTIPDLLVSTRCLRVVFVPSLSSTSPPKLSKSIVSPTVGGFLCETCVERSSSLLDCTKVGLVSSLAVSFNLLLLFLVAGFCEGALRFLSSTMMQN